MATLAWSSPEADRRDDVVVFRSSLPLRSRRFTIGFLRDTLRVKEVLDRLASEPDGGLVSYRLTAHPLRNRYTTESAWCSAEHLGRFAADPVHVAVMRRLRGKLGDATFEQLSAATPAG